MVKVVKEGKHYKPRQIKCNQCQSILSFLPCDEESMNGEDMYGLYTRWSIICSHCKSKVTTRVLNGELSVDFRIPVKDEIKVE